MTRPQVGDFQVAIQGYETLVSVLSCILCLVIYPHEGL
ncbi:conserved hypothetical protein [delta proteobacterium NaphS2]|nr:conserved hypothetical protein [delta proteobacterium NaphS2]EFK07869.1 conserved hypothetical protein [delta proteobacterium NaphS2]